MTVTQQDVDSFHRFASQQLDRGASGLTLAGLLEKWSRLREQEDVNDAIREGLEDIDAGRVKPASEVMDGLRRKYELPPS